MHNDRTKASTRLAMVGTKKHVSVQTGCLNLHTEPYKKPKTLAVFHPSRGRFSVKTEKERQKLHTWVKQQGKEISRIHSDGFRGEGGGCHRQTDDVGNGQEADTGDACWE